MKNLEFAIAGRPIGPDHPPFIIAELSGNHNGKLERALAIVDAAHAAGADAIKLQTYTPNGLTIASDGPDFTISDPNSPWFRRSLHELYTQGMTPWEWHAPIFDRARKLGMIAFSSPFEKAAVAFLASLDVPAFKIASFENVDLDLVRAAAAQGKPLIISTGLATSGEIETVVRAAREAGAQGVMVLKCTSAYPASPRSSNLRTIPHLAQLVGAPVGLSDHTLGNGAAIAAIALGAVAIEKHITLNRDDGGVDSAFSLEPSELRALCQDARNAWEALGAVSYGATPEEHSSLVFRRSLYVVEDVAQGESFTERNVRCIRPGFGLAPIHKPAVMGRRAGQRIPRGTPLSWDCLG
jgi:N-acetylneuraminate synthase